jgi:hypothetical protein
MGESCQLTLFSTLTLTSGGRVYDALHAALDASGGDALIDVTADASNVGFGLVERACVVVQGQAIRFR